MPNISYPSLSIIVPVYNDSKNLDTLLQSIFKSCITDFEVIVVDDASTDHSVKQVALSYNVRYYRHSTNRCVAATRNTGAKHAGGSTLLFFDSDVELENDTLLRFSNAYKNNGTVFFQALTSPTPANTGFGAELIALLWHFETIVSEKLTLYSLCFSIKRSLFFRLGGFDECFTGLGAEEFDFAQRLELSTEIKTDRTLLVKHNFQPVLPRAYSLFKRTIRYTLLFILRTRRLDNQVGRPMDGLGALFSVLSLFFLFFWGAAYISPFGFEVENHFFWPGLLFFILHSFTLNRFFAFLIKTKGLIFFLRAVPVLYLWSLASGSGILVAIIKLPFVTFFKPGYMTPQLIPQVAGKGK